MTTGSKTLFEQVGEFNKKFGLPVADSNNPPHLLDKETADYRFDFLLEELKELLHAQINGDIIEIADALVDIVYVALGTAHFYGLPFDTLFEEVQRSNMTKVRAARTIESKRNSLLDVVKPKGWQKPNLTDIIYKYWVKYKLE